MDKLLDFDIVSQPDETTCGPTCLHSLYQYYGDPVPLETVISEVHALEEGGTLGVLLACHALRRGYGAAIYSYNLQMFDPTWFELETAEVRRRLLAQRDFKEQAKLSLATDGYLEFLELGGKLRFEDLTGKLIRRYLGRSTPILTGLSATYLYQTPREHGPNADWDDVRGEPSGHFVVLCGYDRKSRRVLLADPLEPNPVAASQTYSVTFDRLIGAIFLGALTYDANLVVLEPPEKRSDASCRSSSSSTG